MTAALQTALFGRRRTSGRRIVITGQVGVDKKPFIEELARLSASRGQPIRVFHVGDMMYAESRDVRPGRILDLPLARLAAVRRGVFKDILAEVDRHETVIVNTHAAFRWKHGLFPAFDHDQMLALDADLYITLVDNLDAIHERLTREYEIPHSLKDILVWREEEILATEVLANAVRGHGCFYIFARAAGENAVESLYRLMFKPQAKRVYASFPMTHVMELPQVLVEIDAFRAALAEHFVTFDPGDMDEKRLLVLAAAAMQAGNTSFALTINGRPVEFDVAEVSRVARDIDAQIYARDFKLIDQSDMIVSFIPELPSGTPGISSGVERELQHAYESTKEVYIVWQPAAEPSPFITETATGVFASVEDLLTEFQRLGYIGAFQKPLFRQPPSERGRYG